MSTPRACHDLSAFKTALEATQSKEDLAGTKKDEAKAKKDEAKAKKEKAETKMKGAVDAAGIVAAELKAAEAAAKESLEASGSDERGRIHKAEKDLADAEKEFKSLEASYDVSVSAHIAALAEYKKLLVEPSTTSMPSEGMFTYQYCVLIYMLLCLSLPSAFVMSLCCVYVIV
jgi:chromosome segregation ATPase